MNVRVSDFRRVVFFTGAGMSAESGIPTYRGKGGLWHEYNYEDYACEAAFVRDPGAVWEFHNKRRAAVAGCEPNAGHSWIAALGNEREGISVVTQNIDGLHQKAGSSVVYELHGSLWRVRCDEETKENFDVPFVDYKREGGGFWRPDIVWFGDMLNESVIRQALTVIQECDLLVSIGTSGVVFPAAEFPILAKKRGATLVEINPEETQLSPLYDVCLRGAATEMLPKLLEG